MNDNDESGNKHAVVRFDGRLYNFKAGYIYTGPIKGRAISLDVLSTLRLTSNALGVRESDITYV